MNRENVLFGIIGILLGLIIGFTFANSVNKNAALPVAGQSVQGLPEGHPDTGAVKLVDPASPEGQAIAEKAKKETDNFDAQIKAAEIYYQVQSYDEAIGFLTQANKLQPDQYEVIVHLGNANFDANKFAEAEKWYLRALGKNSGDISVRTDLGLTFMFREPADYDRAIKEFKQSLETDQNHPQTLQNLTVAYTKKGDSVNANAILARFEKAAPGNTTAARLREDIANIGKSVP